MNKIRFKSLSSGSCGNCYFLGSFDDKGNCECAVLIDAGVSPRRLKKELAVDGISPEIISGILVTHDHYDHVRALGSYCKLHRKPVWTTPKLCIALMNKRLTGEYLARKLRQQLGMRFQTAVPVKIKTQLIKFPD